VKFRKDENEKRTYLFIYCSVNDNITVMEKRNYELRT